jgi:O-antigen/teichoic acid export membrane protein
MMSEVTPTTATVTPRNFTKTLVAMLWMGGTRGLGLLWTVVLIHQLGIGSYGLYGMASAICGLVGPALDNAFNVRAIRESEERFVAERTARFLVALSLIAAGAALIPFVYFVGFGLIVAGGENMFNVVKSRLTRDGHPDRAGRIDTVKQATSVLAGGMYLVVAHAPTLLVASLMYCTPYAAAVLIGAVVVRKCRPAIPGPPRLIAALTGEMLGTMAYFQADVLFLAWLTDSTVVGYYTLASMVVGAVISVGQAFAMTYHEPLRHAEGALSAGPPLKYTLGLASAGGILVFVIGVGLLISPAPTQLAVTMMIMSGFATFRIVSWIFQVILYNQRRDLLRLTAAVALVPLKLGLIAVLAPSLGAVGAAISSTAGDAVLLAVFTIALYRKKRPNDNEVHSSAYGAEDKT